MAKHAFTVEDGLVPGHSAGSLGHSTAKFTELHMSADAHIDGDANIGGDVISSGTLFDQNGEVSGGGGSGGGITDATAIAYSIALG